MNYRNEHSEFQLKKRSFFILLIAGGCASAFAQAPAPSLPSLPTLPAIKYDKPATIPSLPEVNLPSASSAVPSLPTIPTVSSVSTTPLPSLGGVPSLPGVVAPKSEGSPTPIVLHGKSDKTGTAGTAESANNTAQPTPTIPDVQVDANATPEGLPMGGMPALPLPGEQSADVAMPMPMSDGVMPTFNFPVDVALEEPPVKTWETRLEPAIIPKKTDYNYKRNLLSETIYRTSYDKHNRHLPRRVTRDDYANLLFNSVAKNDLNTTRALLNAGVSINAMNTYGETPLMLAQRMGATQVAALLVARGATN